MAVVVVDSRRVVLGVLRREAPGVRLGAVALLSKDRAERRVVIMGNDLDSRVRAGSRRHDLAHVLVPVMRVEARRLIRAEPRERARRDGLHRVPDEGLAHDRIGDRPLVRDLQVAVVEEPLAVLRPPPPHVVVGHRERRIVGIAHPKNRAVLAVVSDAPETGLGRDQRLVAVIVVGEGLGRLGEVDLVGCGGDKVFGLVTVCDKLAERRVGFEIGEAASGGIVEEVAAEVVGTEPVRFVTIDGNKRIEIGFAS